MDSMRSVRVLFVCTGNTCRSPLAEVICKQILATRWGCSEDDLPARGVVIASAGIAAYAGDPASPESLSVAQELGLDLSMHRSRRLHPDELAQCDYLITMTLPHRIILESALPATFARPQLLCGDEGDLDDPIGQDLHVYRECAQTIRRHLERLLTEWRLI